MFAENTFNCMTLRKKTNLIIVANFKKQLWIIIALTQKNFLYSLQLIAPILQQLQLSIAFIKRHSAVIIENVRDEIYTQTCRPNYI